ncbi:hypothetical protein J4407_01920 [Candidatus Pacearchaeota archaeon]|nr:hypothetical protein [Candidatus Pacearchaeota archaeon]
MKISKKNKKVIIAITILIIAIAIVISGFVYTEMFAKNSDVNYTDDESFAFYDENQCRCFERERLICNDETWTLDSESRICKKGNERTNVLLGCSKYECSGVIYEFNFETEKWEEKAGN